MRLLPDELILGIDPGETTGLCLARFTTGVSIEVIRSWEQKWEDDMLWVHTLLGLSGIDHIVCESFNLYKHKANSQVGSDFPSSQVIGALKLSIGLWNRDGQRTFTLHLQPAGVIRDVAIMEWDRATLGSSEHRKDSYKHIRRFVADQRLRRERR